jgi:hypothetical protein
VLDPVVEGLPKSLRLFLFQKADGGALVLWNEGSGLKRIRLQLPGEDYAMHNLISGRAYPIQAEEVVEVGSLPVFITWRNTGPNNIQKPLITTR